MDTIIKPPKYVREIMKVLEQRGHSTYLVGGCTRDMLLGSMPNDWDLATTATPDQVSSLFEKTENAGITHGTVKVCVSRGKKVEVTTLRREEGYSDHRRPDTVTYISDLTEDLSRRDFTINAIAIPLNGIIMDPFGGRGDLEGQIIRTVGYPVHRFSEDALRMFRAYRFAAKLGFNLDPGTAHAISVCAHLASALSVERLRVEIDKILRSKNPHVMYHLISSGLLGQYLTGRDISSAQLNNLNLIAGNKLMRWAAFCALLDKNGLIRSPHHLLQALKLDGVSQSTIQIGIELADSNLPGDRRDWKLLLHKYGQNTMKCAAAAADVISGTPDNQKQLQTVIKSGECFTLKRLAINGDDLIALGYHPGIAIGRELDNLLAHVIDFPIDNKRSVLITRAIYSLNSRQVGIK